MKHMKKITTLILTLFIGFSALGQQTYFTTAPGGTTSLTGLQYRYKSITPDSLNQLFMFWNGKYNQVYTATEANKKFALIPSGAGYALKDSTLNINKNGYDVFNKTVFRKNIGLEPLNGLAQSGANIVLGGNLNQNTTLTTTGYNFNILRYASGPGILRSLQFEQTDDYLRHSIYDANTNKTTQISTGFTDGILVTDEIKNKGIFNAGDYEANFVPRSLITRQYADGKFVPYTGATGSVNIGSYGLFGGLIRATQGGATADGMGLINVTSPSDGNNYAAFGLTRKFSVAWGIGTSTTGDYIIGSGTTRDIGSTIPTDSVKFRMTGPGDVSIKGWLRSQHLVGNSSTDSLAAIDGSGRFTRLAPIGSYLVGTNLQQVTNNGYVTTKPLVTIDHGLQGDSTKLVYFVSQGSSLLSAIGFGGVTSDTSRFTYKLSAVRGMIDNNNGIASRSTQNVTTNSLFSQYANFVSPPTINSMLLLDCFVNDAVKSGYDTATFHVQLKAVVNGMITKGWNINKIIIGNPSYWATTTLGQSNIPQRHDMYWTATQAVAVETGVWAWDNWNVQKALNDVTHDYVYSDSLHMTPKGQSQAATALNAFITSNNIGIGVVDLSRIVNQSVGSTATMGNINAYGNINSNKVLNVNDANFSGEVEFNSTLAASAKNGFIFYGPGAGSNTIVIGQTSGQTGPPSANTTKRGGIQGFAYPSDKIITSTFINTFNLVSYLSTSTNSIISFGTSTCSTCYGPNQYSFWATPTPGTANSAVETIRSNDTQTNFLNPAVFGAAVTTAFTSGFVADFRGAIRSTAAPRFTTLNTVNGIHYTSNSSGDVAVTAQGAANTLLHGNGASAPTFSAVATADIAAGAVTTAKADTSSTGLSPKAYVQNYTWTKSQADARFLKLTGGDITGLWSSYANYGVTALPSTFYNTASAKFGVVNNLSNGDNEVDFLSAKSTLGGVSVGGFRWYIVDAAGTKVNVGSIAGSDYGFVTAGRIKAGIVDASGSSTNLFAQYNQTTGAFESRTNAQVRSDLDINTISGNQTITGVKTFSNGFISGGGLIFNNTGALGLGASQSAIAVQIGNPTRFDFFNNNTGAAGFSIGANTYRFDINNSGATTTHSYTLPNADGTIALTSSTPVSGTGTFTGDAVTTSFVINHSLGATPTRIGITPTNAASATAFMSGWYISAKTSTTFTITFLTAPVVGTDNITYTAFP